jgi:hypothetical protein
MAAFLMRPWRQAISNANEFSRYTETGKLTACGNLRNMKRLALRAQFLGPR